MTTSLPVLMKIQIGTLEKEILCFPEETILEACLREGLPAPYSCMSGACQSCKAEIHHGKATMEVCETLTPAEISAGVVLCCQAHPVSHQKMSVKFLET